MRGQFAGAARLMLAIGTMGAAMALRADSAEACAQGGYFPPPDIVFRGMPVAVTITKADPPGASSGVFSTWATTYDVAEVFRGNATHTQVVASAIYYDPSEFPSGQDPAPHLDALPGSEVVLANRQGDGSLSNANCVSYNVEVEAVSGHGYPPLPDPQPSRWPWIAAAAVLAGLAAAYAGGLMRVESLRRAECRSSPRSRSG